MSFGRGNDGARRTTMRSENPSVEESLINHLSLPGQLPQCEESGLDKIEAALLARLEDSALSLADAPAKDVKNVWHSVGRSLAAWRRVTVSGRINKTALEEEVRQLSPTDFLVLYIRKQNAAIFMYRSFKSGADEVVFEVFETCARCEDVLAAKSALQWDFPGVAASIPYETLVHADFLQSLASFLEQASGESVKEFAAHTKKAGFDIVENRETSDPGLISSVLIALLEANGQRINPVVLRKRVRDDVCWNNAAIPWRRLPLWLVLRVCIQRHIMLQSKQSSPRHDQARVEYKFFICHVLAGLLDDVRGTTTPDRLSHLTAKLCRRLVKLESETEAGSTEAVKAYRSYIAQLGKGLIQSVSLAKGTLEDRWESFKESTKKTILPLPGRAEPEALSLTFAAGSRGYLRDALARFRNDKHVRPNAQKTSSGNKSDSDASQILKPYFKLASSEAELCSDNAVPSPEDGVSQPLSVVLLANKIRRYICNVGNLYDCSVEQKSAMILTVMDCWMRMDQSLCDLHPLLAEYHPGFMPEIMDVLHISQLMEMRRLQTVQTHIRTRIERCSQSSMTIFDDPQRGCFAERFVNEAPEGGRIWAELNQIRLSATVARRAKEEEWSRKTKVYEDLAKKVERSTCVYLSTHANQTRRGNLPSQYHDPECPRCAMQKRMQHIKIQIFEDYLPADDMLAKVAAFEIQAFPAFEAYRDTTWFIISKLGTPTKEDTVVPKCSIREYQQLQPFVHLSASSFRLASTTKSFLNTHYATVSLPVDQNQVLRPHGLRYAYFDETTVSWPGRRRQWPTFAHLCALGLPSSSPLAPLINTFPVDRFGPSSYEIMASQSACGTGVNVHEWLSVQSLLSGSSRRWISLLTELGSSNINFSTESMAVLVNHLAIQAGPAADNDDIFRKNHGIFHDSTFRQTLFEQIHQKLDGIATNWREVYAMESMTTIAIRLCALCPQTSRGGEAEYISDDMSSCVSMLLKIRDTTLGWQRLLREETKKATDAATAKRYQLYALWAALLCKRILGTFEDNSTSINSAALSILVECSITVQDNLAATVNELSDCLKSAIIRDTKMMFKLEEKIVDAVKLFPDHLLSALSAGWPDVEGQTRKLANRDLHMDNGSVSLTVSPSTEHSRQQDVVYNYRHGILLVDGMPVGKLPSDHSTSSILEELFGNQSLLTYPSSLKGMQYTLCIRPFGNQVHVGFVGQRMIVRVCVGYKTLEFIPREIFGTHQSFDLPGPLLTNCIQWLDLETGRLEVRQKPNIWQAKETNWHVDLSGRCTRVRGPNKDVLIDPHARLFHRIARNLEGLEMRHQLVVYERRRGNAAKTQVLVDVPRLQLIFFVRRGMLQSLQFQAAVSFEQDIGTWHGLQSKLVLESFNGTQRMVLVPLGDFRIERDGEHVRVKVHVNPRETSSFGKFSVNTVLGRIESAPEPTLIYTKALIHALTSHSVPDRLTGKTGTEEALHWLSSGTCQPWSPLGVRHLEILRQISQLTPKREYYPECLRNMKKESWDSHLTTAMQHDAFGNVVRRITDKSSALSIFALQAAYKSGQELCEVRSWGDSHLNARAWLRWQLTHRAASFSKAPFEPSDLLYASRDRGRERKRMHMDIFEISWLIRTGPSRMQTERNLVASLSQCSMIHGYSKEADKGDVASISDRLNIDLKQSWGILVNLARKFRRNKYSLMFLFAPMCYKYDVDMDLMRTILAFAYFDELLSLTFPEYEKYEHFQQGQCPNEKYLLQLVDSARIPPPPDEIEDLAIFGLSSKAQRKLRDRKQKHEQMSARGCGILVQHLLGQWPCAEPNTGDLDGSLLVDIDRAMEIIRPEWKRLFENTMFENHIVQVQKLLTGRYTDERIRPSSFVQDDQEPVFPAVHDRLVPLLEDLVKMEVQGLPKSVGPAQKFTFLDMPGVDAASTHNPATQIPVHSYSAAARNTANYHGFGSFGRTGIKNLGIRSMQPNRVGNEMGHVPRSLLQTSQWTEHAAVTGAIQELSAIVKSFMSTKSRVKERYGHDLLKSIEAFRAKATTGHLDTPDQVTFRTEDETILFGQLQAELQELDRDFSCHGGERVPQRVWLLKAGLLWPVTTTITLLEQLRSTARLQFGTNVKERLVRFGVTITEIQRSLRLNDLAMKGDHGRYTEESNNKGHSNWNPMEYPDWLLLEIESSLLIRPGQVDVALATISPSSGTNSVLQMNMGQGKTSCVIPMVAVVVANGKNLARVVVPKALLQQTAQLMHLRLGGLLGRELRHIPFSRKTASNPAIILSYENIQRHMLRHAGVMLCLPEHNMSFMLSGLQQLLDSNIHEARMMVNVQRWIGSVSRDVLDESDYTLAVRTQLIYPSGGQITVDGHPHRWLVAQSILKHVHAHLRGLKRSYPRSIEVVQRPGGGFPLFFFQRHDVEEELLRRLTTDIYQGRTEILTIAGLDTKDRIAIKEFITNHKVRPATADRIKKLCPDKLHVRHTTYLLRGLLVNRILLMTLKKRWNVQYGLHPTREPIAVPYHAKGVPSDQSEFGHPDVAIFLTCLSFYYNGIELAHLKQSLEHVLKSDDPASAYDRWTQSSDTFPDSLREWNSINTDDEGQLCEIWRAVRYNVVVIDYFLNNFVFPRYAKQFKVKLQSNGWDIPLLPPTQAESASGPNGTTGIKGCLTTGFSGTNDNRTMLPLTIKQQDLSGLLHTNAEVLTYLLNRRNREYAVMASKDGKRLSEESFLYMLRERKIKVLIDAGAQIVEMDNITLIKKWLEIDTTAPAGLYFDNDNKPWIYSRKSRTKTPLLASSYADGLHECLVYLDEAHTRGTDLKLPPDACGALTLGPGQTKDHTVQAAMRLRQLGTSQSVVFFAPPEVHQSILDLQGKQPNGSKVDSHDVIAWLLENTCDGIEQLQPLYFAQGVDWCRRTQAAIDYPEFLTDKAQMEAYVGSVRQEEQQTLQQLFGPKTKSKTAVTKPPTNPVVSGYMKALHDRKKDFQDTGRAVHASALQEVEQEREIEQEVETVQQVKRAAQFAAHNYPGLHKDLKIFAQTGRLPAQSLCCSHVFHAMSRTGLGRKFSLSCAVPNSNLFFSAEFEKTVKLASEKLNDNFIRPVNWILWSEVTETAIVLIPEEAESVLPILRAAEKENAPAYLLIYSAPITRKMLHFNNLRYYTVPALPQDWLAPQWLKTQLGMFSGRLYFEWNEYEDLVNFFAISDHPTTTEDFDKGVTESDAHGWVDGVEDSCDEESAKGKQVVKSFVKNPLVFMQEWLATRRRGQDFAYTPMGYITQGKQLQSDHPFFRESAYGQPGQLVRPALRVAADNEADEVVYEAGMEDIPVADDESDSDAESEIEYDDDELYPSEEEVVSEGSRLQSSSSGEGEGRYHVRDRQRSGRSGVGRGREGGGRRRK